MTTDISQKTILFLVILTLIFSIIATLVILNEIGGFPNFIAKQPLVEEPVSKSEGKVTLTIGQPPKSP